MWISLQKEISKSIEKDSYILVLSGGVAISDAVTDKIQKKIVENALGNRIKLIPNRYEPVDGGINIGLNYLQKNK